MAAVADDPRRSRPHWTLRMIINILPLVLPLASLYLSANKV